MNRGQAREQPAIYSATKWAFVMNWGDKGVNALFTFVLAAILGPRDFGIVAIALAYIAFVQIFLDQGFSAALIQRPNLEPEHLDTVFWVCMIISPILMVFTIGLSYWGARVNNLSELMMVVSVLSVSLPIEGLTVVQGAILKRAMDFKTLSLRSNGSVLAGGVVGLVMALAGYGVWALVAQQVIRDLSALVLLWAASTWRPHLRFSWKHLRELLGFSVANFMAKMGVFANSQFDALIIGIFLGPVAVGLYRLAERIMATMLDIMSNSLQTISFAQFSRVQSDSRELKRTVLFYLWLSLILTVPSMVGLGLSSNLIIYIIGQQWASAANALKMLCILGIAMAFVPFTGPLLQAVSRAKNLAMLNWMFAGIWAVVLAGSGFAFRHYDVDTQVPGIALARLLMGCLISTPILVHVLMRVCGISLHEIAHAAGSSMVAAVATAVAIVAIQYTGLLESLRPVYSLAAYAVTGGLAAGLTLITVDSRVRSLVRFYFCSSPR